MIIINVLSLFDGMSNGQIALKRSGINVNTYYASEIEKDSIIITQKNYPNTVQLGDVENWGDWDLSKIDLLIGGSPCQGFSRSGKQLNFEDPRSKLFFTYVDILNTLKPKYFLLENVKMKKEWEDVITEYLNVSPILIDSSLVSSGRRERLYWTNIPGVEQPTDKNIFPRDIIENYDGTQYASSCNVHRYFKFKDKFSTLTATYWKGIRGAGRPAVSLEEGYFDDNKSLHRMLTPLECERLMTVPEGYTEGVSKTSRYKMLGNGWTVDVISHILSFIK